MTPDGDRSIEDFRPGDRILSRSESNPEGELEVKMVEEVFQATSGIFQLRVNGHVIRTTEEHPFFVYNKGWVSPSEMQVGDQLLSHDGRWVVVEEIAGTGDTEVVYNLRIADYHTYFVGAREWGFSVWAHNLCNQLHHYVPQFMGSLVKRGSSILTPFLQIGHIQIHRALNRYLAPLGMAPSKLNRTVDIVRNFSKEERLRALVSFYRQYQSGAHYNAFIKEIRATLRAGLFS
jgi:hypothetical protein